MWKGQRGYCDISLAVLLLEFRILGTNVDPSVSEEGNAALCYVCIHLDQVFLKEYRVSIGHS